MKLLTIFSFSVAVIASPIIEPARTGSVQEEMRWQGWVPNGQLVEISKSVRIRKSRSNGKE